MSYIKMKVKVIFNFYFIFKILLALFTLLHDNMYRLTSMFTIFI